MIASALTGTDRQQSSDRSASVRRGSLACSGIFTACLCLAGALALLARFRSAAFLNTYDDDAFYYFKIARNIADFHRSTFDGIHLTNGYHPLWMATLVGLSLIAHGPLFFVFVQLVAVASFSLIFLFSRELFRILSANCVFAELGAMILALQASLLIRGGMEVVLALPLVLAICWYRLRPQFDWSWRSATVYGLLCALAVLSRLDSVIFVAILCLLEFCIKRPPLSQPWLRRAAVVLTAVVPVVFYAVANHHLFHTWMPVSGQAKQLLLRHTFFFNNPRSILHLIVPAFRVLIAYPALFAIVASPLLLLRPNRRPIRPDVLIVSISLLIFPVAQVLTFCSTSDWPIWPWYLYSCPLAMAGALLLLFSQFPGPDHFALRDADLLLRTMGLTFAFLFAIASGLVVAPRSWDLYAADIQKFARDHKGIYAMGDCAGTTGYLIDQPVVQLEGLVMDAEFLNNIRNQRDLTQVLGTYGVRYYVSTDARLVNGCYVTSEPSQAGPAAPRMRGRFCQAPVASFPHPDATVDIFELSPPLPQ